MGLLTLTFDRLTLKLVCESHLRWGTFLPNLGMLGLWVLELFAMYATDGQTDGRTDKRNAYCPVPHGRRHNNVNARCTGNDGHNVSHSNYYIWPFGLSADISRQKYVFG